MNDFATGPLATCEALLCFELPPDLMTLRDECLKLHGRPKPGIPEIPLSDATAWTVHTDAEPWIVWKARKFAARMEAIPVALTPGESVVGKPPLRDPSPDELAHMEAARAALADMPQHPGGDIGHFHPDFAKMFRVGVGGILAEIRQRNSCSRLSEEQREFYRAAELAMEGFATFIRRHAEACEAMAGTDPVRADRWRLLAAVNKHIADRPPESFHQAVQLMNLTVLAAWYGEDHGQSNYGRMDQTLRPFYEADRAADRITRREALELICCLFIQQNRMHWPGGAVAAVVGGLDAAGRDVTNDLTYLCLAARLATRLVYPTVAIAWHDGTPSELMDFGMRMLATGAGDPAFFNDAVISAGLRAHGVEPADSHNWMNSTCVEIKVAGASNIWVANPYISCPGALLEAMRAEAEGTLPPANDFAEFAGRVKQQLAARIRAAAERNERVWQQRRRTGCQPFASCLVRDCLARGLDHDRGGARYQWVENSWVGLANLVDSLVAIRALVFGLGCKRAGHTAPPPLSMAEFYHILETDFAGDEPLRRYIETCLPRYGTDDDEADELACEFTQFLMDTTECNAVGGHRYVPGFFCWVQHERIGSQTMATPDGRKAGYPLADGAGPGQGRARSGPTAAVLSTTKWPHERAIGGLVHNVKFTRHFLTEPINRSALRRLIETYLKRGGFEIQVNVVDNADLRDAQAHPDRYRDLLVRVAGYSDYFVHLNRSMQDELIRRTEFDRA